MSQADIHTNPDSHARAFDLCVAGRFSTRQAMVMANGFAARGHTDASEGCTSYVLSGRGPKRASNSSAFMGRPNR